jgi:(2Fe-2S) ferredoxin
MARFEHLLFVCTNSREAQSPGSAGSPGSPKPSCAARGGEALLARLKELTREHRLQGKVRVTRSGCLDYCSKGCALVAFSADAPAAQTWYTHVTAADAEALFNSHVLQGKCYTERLDSRADRHPPKVDQPK